MTKKKAKKIKSVPVHVNTHCIPACFTLSLFRIVRVDAVLTWTRTKKAPTRLNRKISISKMKPIMKIMMLIILIMGKGMMMRAGKMVCFWLLT